jgi:hypothetical protein
MNNIIVVIFSYNRAIQLDCLLKSVIERFKNIEYKISIIYHYNQSHQQSYKMLTEKYKKYDFISFSLREDYSFPLIKKLPYLLNILNFVRFLKHSYLRKSGDNFKALTEATIKNSGAEFTMFLTDDGYFYKDVLVPSKVFDLIRNKPNEVSYRMYVGDNLSDFPTNIQLENELYVWNYYDKSLTAHWAYPFAVDATIYDSAALLKSMQPVLYHMPSTLEAYIVDKCLRNKSFAIGYSPKESNYVGLFLNRVSKIAKNFAVSIDINLLNDYYIKGYTLEYEFEIPPKRQAFIPNKIILTAADGTKENIELSEVKEQLQ